MHIQYNFHEKLNKWVAAGSQLDFHSILRSDDLKNRIILFFKSSWYKIASAARNWINSIPQSAATTFAFTSVWILLLWLHPWFVKNRREASVPFSLKMRTFLYSPSCIRVNLSYQLSLERPSLSRNIFHTVFWNNILVLVPVCATRPAAGQVRAIKFNKCYFYYF